MTLTVITGPPGAGKTTHIRNHAKPGDIVIDYDLIATALTTGTQGHHDHPPHLHPITQAARNAALKAALDRCRTLNVWIVDAYPTPAMRAWYHGKQATFIHLDPGEDICAARIATRPTPIGGTPPPTPTGPTHTPDPQPNTRW